MSSWEDKHIYEVINTIKGMNVGEFRAYIDKHLTVFKDPAYVIPMIKEVPGLWFEFLPHDVFNNREVMKAGIKKNGTFIRFSDTLIDDEALAIKAVSKTPHAFCHLSLRLRGEHSFVDQYLHTIKGEPLIDKVAPQYWKNHLGVAKRVLSKYGGLLIDFPHYIRKNVELCKVSINSEPLKAYQQIDESLKGNEDLLHYAISKDGGTLGFADSKFQSDKSYVLEAVSSVGYYFQNKVHSGTTFSKDLDVIRTALLKSGYNYESVDEDVKKENIDFAVIALECNGRNFAFVPERHHDNPKVLAALFFSDSRQFFSNIRIMNNLKEEKEKQQLLKGISQVIKNKPLNYFIQSLQNMDNKFYARWKADETISVAGVFNTHLEWYRKLLFDYLPVEILSAKLQTLKSPVFKEQIKLEIERKTILELKLSKNRDQDKQTKRKISVV